MLPWSLVLGWHLNEIKISRFIFKTGKEAISIEVKYSAKDTCKYELVSPCFAVQETWCK